MTIIADQVESVCACCGSPVPQIPGAHRRRRYCDNNGQCKQDAYRARRKQKRKQKMRERWPAFAQETLDFLESLMITPKYGDRFAEALAELISKERDRQRHAIDHYQECTDRQQLEEQLVRDLNAVRINVASEDLFKTLYGQALLMVKAREDEIVHLKTRIEKQYERRIAKQQARIEELESKIEKQSTRKADTTELEQARTDLRQLRQERAHEQEHFHEIYEVAQGQRIDLGAAHHRIKDLEEELEQVRRGNEGVQVRQAQEVKPATNEEMIARLLAVGERLQYRRLLIPHISSGAESWQHFAESASLEQLSQAIATAEHYYENLIYLDELEQRARVEAREKKTSKAS